MSSPILENLSCEATNLDLPCRVASPEQYVAVGKSEHPRWLIPAHHKLNGDEFLGWKPYRPSSKLAWTGLKALLRWAGSAGLAACGGKRVTWSLDCDWHALGWSKLAAPVPLVYMGTPGEQRKAVLHLLDSKSGVCELIVKVPLTGAAASAIGREAATLRDLERHAFAAAPRLVQYDQGHHVSSQTVVHGVRCEMKFTREVASLLQMLHLQGQTITLAESARELARFRAGLDLSSNDDALVTSALAEIQDDTALPAYRIHGDFTPWNIRLGPNGATALVDWEDALPRGLPLHDSFHFAHMTRSLFNRNPQPAFSSMPFRAYGSPHLWLCRKLEIAYLVRTLLQQLSSRSPKQVRYFSSALRFSLATRP